MLTESKDIARIEARIRELKNKYARDYYADHKERIKSNRHNVWVRKAIESLQTEAET